jgi:hypothetical protein
MNNNSFRNFSSWYRKSAHMKIGTCVGSSTTSHVLNSRCQQKLHINNTYCSIGNRQRKRVKLFPKKVFSSWVLGYNFTASIAYREYSVHILGDICGLVCRAWGAGEGVLHHAGDVDRVVVGVAVLQQHPLGCRVHDHAARQRYLRVRTQIQRRYPLKRTSSRDLRHYVFVGHLVLKTKYICYPIRTV